MTVRRHGGGGASGQARARRKNKSGAYGSRPIKRRRRSPAEIQAIREALYAVAAEDHPVTIRQIFYRLVSAGVIAKTEREYKTIIRLATAMRRDGDLPYDWVADSTRWMRKPQTWSGLDRMLAETAQLYRRSLWDDQEAYVEVWCEKEALAGVLYEVTEPWDVPLMVTRGYPSLTFLHSAAQTIGAVRKSVYLYYFGDYDPSGLDIARTVQRGIGEMISGNGHGHAMEMMWDMFMDGFGADDNDNDDDEDEWAPFQFIRVAVTAEQIEEMDLPTRPTKTTDTRSKGFEGESVELDAIPPATLRAMVTALIEEHINPDALAETQRIEKLERETLAAFAAEHGGDAP